MCISLEEFRYFHCPEYRWISARTMICFLGGKRKKHCFFEERRKKNIHQGCRREEYSDSDKGIDPELLA